MKNTFLNDIEELGQIATSKSFDDFVLWIKGNCDWRDIDGEFIDFDFKSLSTSVILSDKCLIGSYDCFDETGWVDTIAKSDIYLS